MLNLDKELVSQIKNLKVEFKDAPQPELLVRILNQESEIVYQVEVVTSEFTSLCPLNLAQPDYATIFITYLPSQWCVELKSLKYYLVSFRQVPIFHEQVPAKILKALYDLLEPHWIKVEGQFTTRGGLLTTVRQRGGYQVFEVLKEKLPATFLDVDKIALFGGLMGVRTSRGKQEYPEEYKFDPLVEAQEECVDIAVYAMIEYYRIEHLKEKIDELASKESKAK